MRLAWNCHPSMHFETNCQRRRVCFRLYWMSPLATSNEPASMYSTCYIQRGIHTLTSPSTDTSKGGRFGFIPFCFMIVHCHLRLKSCGDEMVDTIAGQCTSEAHHIYIYILYGIVYIKLLLSDFSEPQKCFEEFGC